MQYSHSRVECFEKCRFQFKLRYIEKLRTIYTPAANSPLVVGSALHLGLEEGIEAMENYYYNQYPVIDNLHINEMIKLNFMVRKAQEVIDGLIKDRKTTYEYEINFPTFRGFVDLIIHNKDGTIDVYDFKYSNNVDNYLESKQLHLYKYFLEKEGFKVSKLGFIFIGKTFIRQKKTEDLYQFRKRLRGTLKTLKIRIIEEEYKPGKVEDFFKSCGSIENERLYEKTASRLCDWCEFQKYCEEDVNYMLLPKNERREIKIDESPDMWVYGESYTGKSTFVDKLEDLIFINTDGNIDNTSSPVVRIKNQVTYEGRLKKEKLAWEGFLEIVDELEKKDNDFKIVCVDLVEDLYEHCRLFTYRKLGIDHEQDAGFGKGWDMVRTEFLSAMKRLKNLGYQIIFISKEATSEITLKNGSKITTVKPNINDKIANVLAGIVDLTVRAYLDGEERYLLLDKQENIFGGGRFNFKADKVKLDKDEFLKALKAAQKEYVKEAPVKEESEKSSVKESTVEPVTDEATENEVEAEPEDETKTPVRKSRRSIK